MSRPQRPRPPAVPVWIIAVAVAAVFAPAPAHAQPAPAQPAPLVEETADNDDGAADFAEDDADSTDGGPGLFDIAGRVRQAINDWFRDLAASLLTPALDLIGRTVLSTPDITRPGRVAELWGVTAGMANAFFVLFVLAGGALVMSHETLQVRYDLKEIAPRLVVAFVTANVSLLLAGHAITAANALSGALLGQGVDPRQATAVMHERALAPLESGALSLVLIAVVAAVLAVLLLVVYVLRVAIVVVLVAGAPLALACHALPHTDGLARWWWRALVACLAVQVVQALVLVTAVRVFFQADGPSVFTATTGEALIDGLVVVCLLWLLVRIPMVGSHAVFSGRGSTVVRTVKYYVAARGVKAVLGR